MRIARALILMGALLASVAAYGQQAILQGGPWSPGHAPQYVGQGGTQPVVQDAGGSGGSGLGGNLSEIGITARSPTNTYPSINSGNGPSGEHFCLYDAPIDNATGYHFFCMDPNAQGGGLLDYGFAGGASLEPFSFIINGITYTFPFTIGGIVGPNTTVVGDGVCWNNLIGTLVSDCGGVPALTKNNLSDLANEATARTNLGLGPFATIPSAGTGVITALQLPVNTVGGLTTGANAAANTVYAGPASGPSAYPTFRALVAADVPVPTHIPAANVDYPQSGTGGVTQTLQVVEGLKPATPQAFGAGGAGVTDDTVAINHWLASAAAGGSLAMPCGTYEVTSQPTVTIQAGKHIEISGAGQDCAIILVLGAIDGPAVTFGSPFSSISIHDVTFVSNLAGGQKCLTLKSTFSNPNSALAATNNIYNVTFRGADAYSAQSEYCGTGVYINGISNLNFDKFTFLGPTCTGSASCLGTAIDSAGTGTGSTYNVQINISNSVFNNCGQAFHYGDWTQGLQIVNTNITQCNNGVTTVTTASGQLSELSITGSQINAYTCGVCVNNAAIANVQLVNDQFIIPTNATAVKLSGTNYTISGNQLNGASLTGTVGLEILQSFGNGGTISGNTFAAIGTAFKVDAAAAGQTIFTGNSMVLNTTDYSINASSSALQINDTQARDYVKLPTCNNAIKFSRFMIGDSPTATFNATISTGGGSNYLGANCDASRYFVD